MCDKVWGEGRGRKKIKKRGFFRGSKNIKKQGF